MKITKIRHLAFALLCVSSLMWSTLRAATYTVTVDDINYKVDTTTGEATCTGPTSSSLTKNNVVILDKVSYNGTDYPVTSIGTDAFRDCSGFTGSLTIGENVQSIGNYAFRDCSGFTGSLTIGENVQSIGIYAFYGCSGFTGSLTIGENVESIGTFAFSGCSGFTGSLNIPNSVTSIGSSAFRDCSGLTGVYITNLEAWCKIDFGNENANPLYYAKNLYLNGEPIANLVIPETLSEIKKYTFYNTENITGSLTIPNSVQSIGNYAFRNCSGFNGTLTIGENVQSIGNYAFDGCSGFTGSLTIGKNVQSIGSSAFRDCSGLTGVYITNLEAWCKIDFGSVYANPLYYAKNLYLNGEPIVNLVIPQTISEIKNYTFHQAQNITGTLTIGENIRSIGIHAFTFCIGLIGSLNLPSSVSTIGEEAFNGCSGFTGPLTLPDAVTTIGDYTFQFCRGFTSLTIGENVQSIGSSAFYGCRGIGSLVIPNSVKTIGSQAFMECSGLTDVTIGKNVHLLGDEKFYRVFNGCSNLQWVKCLPIIPPLTYGSNFSNYNIPLYVPAESIEAYRDADDWKKFTNINPITVPATGVELNTTTASLLIGQNYTLTATVLPADATDKTITWASDAESVATVDQDGKVTAVSVGTANITATCGEVSATCVVTVKSLTSDDVTVTPGNGTTEGDEDGSLADNTENGGSLIGNDLTLRIGQTAAVNLNVAVESDVAPEFEWSLAPDGDKVAKMTVAEGTASASFTGLAIGETTYSVKLANTETELASGKVKVIAQNPVKSLSIEPAEVTMAQNALDVQLEAKFNPENASVTALTWTTSDDKVATVSVDGKVSAVGQGTATITATTTDGTELTATCTVTVTAPIDDSFGFEFDESVLGGAEGISLYLGDTYTFTPKAQDGYVLPEVINWSSSDDTTVSVDNDGTVTALKVGEATVTASAEVNSETVTATCKVTVLPIPASSVTISTENATLLVGQSFALTAEVEPDDTTYPTVTWASDKPEVATVDADGKVTAVSVGTANITATCGEVSASCIVTVKTLTSDDVTVTPGNGTTEGDEDGSLADNTENGGSLIGNDLTLRIGQTAELVVKVNEELTVVPSFDWSLGEGGNAFVTLTVSDDTLTASFTGIATGATTYSIYVEGQQDALVTGNILVLDKDGAGVDDITVDGDDTITVYNLQGIRLPITNRKELNGLPHGVYIVNGTKISL